MRLSGKEASAARTGHGPIGESPGHFGGLAEALFEGINQPLVVLDGCFRIVGCNRRFQETFVAAGELAESVGLRQLPSGDRLESSIRQAMTIQTPPGETVFECTDGASAQCSFLLSISRLKPNPAGGQILVMLDEVTEWRRRQAQVMEAGRMVSLGEMVAGVAHEVNNPMAAIMGFAQLTLRHELPNEVRGDIERILAEAKRASRIIIDLQAFARVTRPKKESVVLADVVRKALEFRAYQLRLDNIRVVTRDYAGGATVVGDRKQLEQAFINIVTNAQQAMSESGQGGTLTVEISLLDERAIVSFADDGPGIEAEMLPKVFDPFFTTREVGKGKGLGLSVSYGLIREHDGDISVTSRPGQGATFTVELPLAQASAQETAGSDPTAPTPSSQRLRVLIVDDEPAVAELLARALHDAGHEANVAASSEEAIAGHDLTRYDLVVLDMKMPGLGGEGLHRHIEGLPGGHAPKVLVVTGDTTGAATADFVVRLGIPILEKPFTLDQFMEAIRRTAPIDGA